MIKRVIKFSLGILAIVLAGFGVLYALHFFSPEYRQEQAAIQKLKDIQDQYEKDIYGGDTPEKTLELFIDALKKGDIDLAAKYFDIEHQSKWKAYLENIKNTSGLKPLLDDANRLRLSKKDNIQAFFTIANEKNVVEVTVILSRNEKNRWKIIDL